MSVLVTYATKNGGTAGLAEMIGEALRGEGIDVDVEPVSVINRVDGYEAVVLGAAVYNARWHPDARRFARRHAGALRDRPVWLFSSGPLDHSAEERWTAPRRRKPSATPAGYRFPAGTTGP